MADFKLQILFLLAFSSHIIYSMDLDDDIFGDTLAPLIIPPDDTTGRIGVNSGPVRTQVIKEYTLVFEEGNGETISTQQVDNKKVDTLVDKVLGKLGQAGDVLQAAQAPGCDVVRGEVPRNCNSRISIGDFKALIVKVSDEAVLDNLRKIKRLRFVERAGIVRKNQASCTSQSVNSGQWGLDHIDKETTNEGSDNRNNVYYHDSNGGSGVNIYVVDTGIRVTHTDFGGRAIAGARFCSDGCSTSDVDGHGTHVSGIAGSRTYGVAKASTLVAVKVLGDDGSGFITDVIRGLNWVNTQAQGRTPGKSVINMSLGGPPSSSLDGTVNSIVANGVPVVVAAGNEDANACNFSPSRATSAISVASIDTSQARSSFSNYGSCVDIFAAGQSIQSTWATSNTATATLSGTSMSSPHVAGAVAIFLSQNDCATSAQVRSWLISNAVSGVTNLNGSPNLMAQVNCDNTDSSITCGGATTTTTTPAPSTPCSSGPCLNGGTCSSSGTSFTCSCPPGFSGDRCQINVNECSSSPCVNGVCVDGSNSFTCRCNAGWTGPLCDQADTDECASSPCVNGRCIPSSNGFRCRCNRGWQGVLCNVPANNGGGACSRNPCQNGGTCVPRRGRRSRFRCQCAPGFRGQRCQRPTADEDPGDDGELSDSCVAAVCRLSSVCRRCQRRGIEACEDTVRRFCDRSPGTCEAMCSPRRGRRRRGD